MGARRRRVRRAIVVNLEETGRGGGDASRASGRPAPRRRLAVSSAIFGLATALSRVLGLVREMVASYYFGVSGRINAFTVAFQIPNLMRALVADAALSSSFVPGLQRSAREG